MTKQVLQDEIERKELIIELVEQIYHINLHNKSADEILITLFQNKNALYWDTFEQGQNTGIEISLRALINSKIISKPDADELAKKINEYGHKLFIESKENIDKRIVDKWKEEYDKVRVS